jgi:DNA-binding YbaB/EbfC family protein
VEPGGQLDMQQLLAAAAQMQSQLMSAQQELAEAAVEGTAGGGLVKAVVSGQGELLDLVIAPEAIDPADPADTAQTLADLVLAAIRDASRGASELQEETMAPLASGLGGGGLPGMPGLPGQDGLPGTGLPGTGLPGQVLPSDADAVPDDPGSPGGAVPGER